jgi:hypothetical protein
MRIDLEGLSHNEIPTVLRKLQLDGVRTNGGGVVGDQYGIILVEDADAEAAFAALKRLGIKTRSG